MIAAVLVAWLVAAAAVVVLFARAARITVPTPTPEPDWLWDQPTDVLSDAAVDARFWEIAAHFRVLS